MVIEMTQAILEPAPKQGRTIPALGPDQTLIIVRPMRARQVGQKPIVQHLLLHPEAM